MKKLSYIVLGGMLVFAACQSNNSQDAAQVQHKVDSIANEMIKADVEKLQKDCDDKIMTAAMDSAKVIMEHAKKSNVHHSVKPVPKKETKPAIVPNTNLGKKTDAANANMGTNTGKKTDATATQGQNMGKKKSN
ncbi:MAG: hypothetical protein RL065_1323 [Bacteroidota bacterium]|jgi:hypothetical protein